MRGTLLNSEELQSGTETEGGKFCPASFSTKVLLFQYLMKN